MHCRCSIKLCILYHRICLTDKKIFKSQTGDKMAAVTLGTEDGDGVLRRGLGAPNHLATFPHRLEVEGRETRCKLHSED